MNADFDGAIILEVTNQKNDPHWSSIIRPLAPFALHETFLKRNIPSTVINYTDFWDSEVLAQKLITWCNLNNVKKPFLLGSSLFNHNILNPDKPFAKTVEILKQNFDCKLILGGPSNDYDFRPGLLKPDLIFSGRALHLFEHWIDGDYNLEITKVKGLDLVMLKNNDIIEQPIVTKLYEDYCLTEKDILNFETRLGCKFNCTFCSYEFRNAKKVKDSSCETLYEFFKQAKDEYGITHFSCVDDTFNEDDDKIDNLYNAVTKLDYVPTIVGYSRFDVMLTKQHQVEKLDKIGFHGHFFGIESLHPVANKKIRKGTDKEKAFEFLRMLKQDYPHWHKCSAYIIGLPEEPFEHIMEVMKVFTSEKLLEAIQPSILVLENRPGNIMNKSLMTQDPEKYGLETTKEVTSGYLWKHKLASSESATSMKNRVASFNKSKGIGTVDPWEWITERSIGSRKSEAVELHITDYITRKSEYLISV